MTYDTKTNYVQPITSDTNALVTAIDGLVTGSDTAMYNALVEAEKNLETINGRKSIIVLTDGLDNKSQSTIDDVVSGVSQSGLTISTIGFGDASSRGQVGLDEKALQSLAEKTGGLYSFAGNADALSAVFQQFGQVLQSEYALTYLFPHHITRWRESWPAVSLNGSTAATTSARYNPGRVPQKTVAGWAERRRALLEKR